MPEIKLLDPSVINLIAAGEVVERPASVVKELTENALDAGATRIAVEITKGGLGMIRVADNGCGMDEENAKRAFLKHATSKISTAEDLTRISTLGFRGEALAAISAVSHITLTTKRQSETAGHQLTVNEGSVESCEECGCPDGSVFTVKDLFFNTPARLKFMKSEPAEAGAVQSLLERLALSHPDVSVRLTVNGTEKFQTPGNGDLSAAIFAVFGREFTEMLLPADHTQGNIRVHGFVGKPVYTKANRSKQVFFLNGRYIRSGVLSSGFENSYQNKMLVGRMPVCVLFVEMPEELTDVNVHPGKLEVKFSDENAVAYAVRKAAEGALTGDTGIVPIRLPDPPVKEIYSPVKSSETVAAYVKNTSTPANPTVHAAPQKNATKPQKDVKNVPVSEKAGWTISVPVAVSPAAATPKVNRVVLNDVMAPTSPEQRVAPVPSEAEKPVFPPAAPIKQPESKEEPSLFRTDKDFRLVGEVFCCYAVVERGDDVLFIDKHALHERMNFEKLRTSPIQSQILLQPIVLSLGREENRTLGDNADFLSRFGFLLETLGDDLLVREIPSLIDPDQVEPLLQRFSDALALRRDDTLLDQFYYDIACKASIRSGSETSAEELEQLIGEYFRRSDELQYCPHGRPIVFSLPKHSIEKQFKRVK